ncbi:MAG: hypothetical protein IKS53_05520 [Bacteroidales bacterium]|nr:hypothetical protein [Bacteroidales bacterium]
MSTFILILSISAAILLALLFFNRARKTKHKRFVSLAEQHDTANEQTFLLFDLNLPFTPDVHDVIYVENEYDPAINGYIQKHYEEIQQQFLSKKATFIYLPKLCGQEVSKEVLHYMFPFLQQTSSFVNGDLTIETLKSHILSGSIEGPALIHFVRMEAKNPINYYYTYRPLVAASPLTDQFENYLKHLTFSYRGESETAFNALSKPKSKDDVADHYFNDGSDNILFADKSIDDLTDEVRQRIIELRKRGVQLHLLHELVEERPTLSRLVIDKDYRIFLPDYSNIEITMQPLPKAVFFLFLQHPEGIPFKHLNNYFPELLEIYKHVGNREIEENIINSIGDITDPTKNSINEKCSRIREAFLKHFDTAYAQHYYITGKRGEPKKITLPRELVDWQAL